MARIRGGGNFERKLAEIGRKVRSTAKLSVGFFEDSTYPDGTSVPLVAAVQEFGSPAHNIPSRPFFRNMIAEYGDQFPATLAALLKASEYDVRHAMEVVGEEAVNLLQESIRKGDFAPLAPATVRRKGHDTPLIDTQLMIDSVKYKIEE
jgi:hypothetical protein